MVKYWTVVKTVMERSFAFGHGQVLDHFERCNKCVIWLTTWSNCWNVVNTVTGTSFGSEHGQVLDCCEHSKRCVILLRTWSSNGML